MVVCGLVAVCVVMATNFYTKVYLHYRSSLDMSNSDKVGQNCLTYMETINGMSTRSKIYNKMVHILGCKGVCDTIGCHWEDWDTHREIPD